MAVRKGLVLAAGMGTRLADVEAVPKPLVKIGGVPMLFRTLNSLREAGLTDLAVVVGYKADQVKAALAHYALREDISLTVVENSRFTEPNGISLHVAKEFAQDEPFIMTMVDHLFDPEIVRRLRSVAPPAGCTLAIDRDVPRVFDLEDATKVKINRKGQIVNIGKQIRRYNAIDCGLFRCSAAVFEGLEKAFEKGGFSISDGMQMLAKDGLFFGMPVNGLFWQDMDTPEMIQQAEQVALRVEAANRLRPQPAWQFAF